MRFDNKTREGRMIHRVLRSGSLALGLWALSLTPAHGADLDDRIKSVEQELATLKEQQVELKKEATAAADALPTFSYRQGNGLMI
jgi:uncharacterized small protein (DUF1192 family)